MMHTQCDRERGVSTRRNPRTPEEIKYRILAGIGRLDKWFAIMGRHEDHTRKQRGNIGIVCNILRM
jgi:hypothetical protein